MTNLISRLRAERSKWGENTMSDCPAMCEEAADEIERLQEILRKAGITGAPGSTGEWLPDEPTYDLHACVCGTRFEPNVIHHIEYRYGQSADGTQFVDCAHGKRTVVNRSVTQETK